MSGECPLHGALELKVDMLTEKTEEIGSDVKILVAAHNKAEGIKVGSRGKGFFKYLGIGIGIGAPFFAFIWKVWC